MSPRADASPPRQPQRSRAKKPAKKRAAASRDPVERLGEHLRALPAGARGTTSSTRSTASTASRSGRRRLDPTSELILTILTQNTADMNAEKAYEALRDAYPRDRDAEVHKPGIGWGGDGLPTAPPPDWARVELAPLARAHRRHPARRAGAAEGAADPGDAPPHPRGARRLLARVPRRPARRSRRATG